MLDRVTARYDEPLRWLQLNLTGDDPLSTHVERWKFRWGARVEGLTFSSGGAMAFYPTDISMGIGLDRIFMLRKGIPDIRLLRSTDRRVTVQMLDLEPYRPVSSMPPVRRDISIAVAQELDDEELGDRVRQALAEEADAVEEVRLLSSTAYEDLPPAARDRLGIQPGQSNLLVSIVLRSIDRTLTDEVANVLRDRIYGALHEGSVHLWAAAKGGAVGGTDGDAS